MGAKDSKRSCLSYEEAQKRMSDPEYKRVCEAFKRLSGGGTLLSRQAFIQNVLGEGVPVTIAEALYNACGGTIRGIGLRDLICGLVLLTKGTQEEKIKFLWTLYSNDSGAYIVKPEFLASLRLEGSLPSDDTKNNLSLFSPGQDRVSFEQFRSWILIKHDATVLSKWLLASSCVTLSSELETPTFYQTLAGVTHLEEQDICELEKCFWSLQSAATSGQLDSTCVTALISPPIPASACQGLFLALDVNRDGHVDFKELCCGVSAACRGPTVERMKFCFKVFDMDRDGFLNQFELQHMIEVLLYVARENETTKMNTIDRNYFRKSNRKNSNSSINTPESTPFSNGEVLNELYAKSLNSLRGQINPEGNVSQEDFLVWSNENVTNPLVDPFLELLFQVCHVSLGLKPLCRHHEHEIVRGWLDREGRRGYRVGQFWYLISSEWWQMWLNYTTGPRNNYDYCNCRPDNRVPVEEGIVCDESFPSNGTDFTSHSNEFNSNSTDSMGDLLSKGDSCSIASSSGVSSSSGTGMKRAQNGMPGPINNSNLVVEVAQTKVGTLTGEGGRLRRDTTLSQGNDFELVPESLWKALQLWYGCSLPLPRQVIKPPNSPDVELELYPLNLRILQHHNQSSSTSGSPATWNSIVGGYGAAALSTAGITSTPVAPPRRYLAHTAAFSRLSNVRQVIEFLGARLLFRTEDIRLWHVKEGSTILLEDETSTLQDLGIGDNEQILLEVRNKDLTWPEELGALVSGNTAVQSLISSERRPTITLPPGATGLHNLGNTCFMNAALQAVSNTRPLTLYFQRDLQLCELNSVNPLGTKGQVAKRYAELCRDLWAGSTRSVAPLKLRYCVTKHAPHLGGGGQHDSQELLAWLLDSLHEDLNRVPKKQYSELRDSDGRPDEVVAQEAWSQHLARDHSIITDLFYGQLKSKVTCQTCGHESVRFDPFNLLSLPLPMESYTLCEVLVIRLTGEVPIKYGMRLNSEAKYLELKEQLENLCEIPPNRILLAEVAYSQIKQFLNDEARINPSTATELYAYELPRCGKDDHLAKIEDDADLDQALVQTPLARSPENLSLRACDTETIVKSTRLPAGISLQSPPKRVSVHSVAPSVYTDDPVKSPTYLVAVHRKCVRQETYFLSQHKSKPSLFGVPLLLGCNSNSTCQNLYEIVWNQVTRLLSPLPQSDQTNHATDCDDSLGYEFPFTLKAILQGGQICALCHWTQFCRGCKIPCSEESLFDFCQGGQNVMCIAIDWDPTALHLRYQSSRERILIEHESVSTCRKLHTEPIDLDYCLRAFTSEERLETKYHCSKCQDKQPATKKLQIWRLPPILIVHLKRFDYVNNKWVKTQKVVNFPFKNFDPTAYLASIPQETILRHQSLMEKKRNLENSCEEKIDEEEVEKLVDVDEVDFKSVKVRKERVAPKKRERLESTSLIKTPVVDEDLKDFHEHKLIKGQDLFDLKYQLYAVVSHSGLLNGGHYISYACNPNGHWYCYNDSSCREVLTDSNENNNNDKAQLNYSTTHINPRINSPLQTPLMRRRNGSNSSLSQISTDTLCNNNNNNNNNNNDQKLTNNLSDENNSSSETHTLVNSKINSPKNSPCFQERKLMKKIFDGSENSLNSFKCAYTDVKVPKIDTSSAYILFYERSGLDYRPYLPEVASNSPGQAAEVELEESETELRKNCVIQ
ncbi:ubiquitin carboxyl-terminal hydrolase 32 isoform X2 [Onthophagus taurus]|uniref:ubiquitin carboxyl-terminal hydrolase 32 isoform X2 n=1 Tax=Onthophagus taurus TaxID=166361 RepID=UPI000C20A104|nr:ubiquitin carboxyl-terminal hydrolase 32-like isoform X2 [Onthophagus taurus]